jgi:hypothetical protein
VTVDTRGLPSHRARYGHGASWSRGRLAADGKPGPRVDPLRMTEVGEELVALHPEPGPRVDPLRVTEVRVGLHGQSVCQHLLTVLGVPTRRATACASGITSLEIGGVIMQPTR